VILVSQINDEDQIAAVGLAISLIITMPFAVIIGIATVLETLVGQAYGAREYGLCTVHLNR